MSMAGQEGPLRGMRGFASIATGYSGLELMVGYPEIDTSTGLLPFGLGDTTMAIQAVIGCWWRSIIASAPARGSSST